MTSRITALIIIILLVVVAALYPSFTGTNAGTLAVALGLVILVGYLVGEIGAHLQLPRLTGYIIAGMVIGPYCSNLLTHDAVDHLDLIDQIALALIALSAGGEFHLSSLKQRMKAIGWITASQVVLIFVLGTTSFYTVSTWLPFLEGMNSATRWAAGMVFGVIAIAQSPATTIAIITETKSAGPMTETVLGITVIKDVLVIIIFTSLVPLLKMLEFDQGGVNWGFLLGLFNELTISVLVGLGAGWFISIYLRFVNKNQVFFVLAFSYLISEGSKTFHLDTLIVCIAAGIWVTNASKRGKALIDMIEDSSLLIYVVFFTITGAALDLITLQSMFGLAMLLVAIRLLWTGVSTYAGAKLSREHFVCPQYLWMLFLPQAGVSLGLLSILIKEGFEWGEGMQTLMVAVIAVNQIIGPIFMKIGLAKCGELGKAQRK